jgi:hypothetical protein
VIDAIHASPRGAETDIYAAVLVTDNVATDVSDNDVTLKAAEDTIDDTAKLRQNFLLNVFRRQGILKDANVPEATPRLERPRTGTSDR